MSDRGKYHGQRLKAKDVLRLYAAGERDFRGTILWGCSFRGTNLSGANFTRADIRSSRFIDACLSEGCFSCALLGTQNKFLILQLLILACFAIAIGLGQAYSAEIIQFWISQAFRNVYGSNMSTIAIMSVSALLISIGALFHEGPTLRFVVIALSTFGFGSAIAVITSGSMAFGMGGLIAVIFPGSIVIACLICFSLIISTALLLFHSRRTYGFLVSFFIGSLSVFSYNYIFGSFKSFGFFFGIFLTVLNCLFGWYFDSQIRRGNERFENISKLGLFFSNIGGTSFSGADLARSSFADADLARISLINSSNLPIVLTHVRWHGSEGLDRARLGTSNLQDPRVRNLLVSLNGVDQDLTNADLRGVNLAGATLHRISLKGANLNGATLAGAELHGANLTNAQCVGTDFTGAHLTGACLEAWNIDETTILKDIDCEYVFLKAEPDAKGNRERRPHNPDKVFQPGDFEKFFKEMLDTVQILIRNGVDPRAFQAAFEQVMADNPDITRDSIQAMEKQGDDVLLTLKVPAGTDKAQVERSWDEGYQLGLEAGYTKGLLQGQTQRAEDVKEVALGFSKFLSSIQINNMNNPINAGDGGFINTGSMEGNVVNLGELSGQVTVQINQLPDASPGVDQRSLKDLLTELQAAIEAETELSDVEKKEALGEVGKLAEAGTQPQDNAMQRMAKRAAANLKSITEPLTEASNLVTVCKNLLPLILAVF